MYIFYIIGENVSRLWCSFSALVDMSRQASEYLSHTKEVKTQKIGSRGEERE